VVGGPAIGGAVLGRPSPALLDRRLARAVAEPAVSYDHVGSTAPGHAAGPRLHTEHRDAGHGRDAFERVADGLRTWAAQRHLGASVHPPGAPVETGQTVLVALPFGPLTMLAPNRIVSVTEAADEVGFAYGTLRGHPYRGEEGFTVRLLDDGTVRITIAVDAEPANPAVRLAAPVATRAQRRALRGYLDGLAALA
jgi:uncharacterized protein (UPF0548 family)